MTQTSSPDASRSANDCESAADVALTDPEFLVHSDPVAIFGLLDRARSEAARLAAVVYRASAGQHRLLDPTQWRTRRDLLALDAARYGAPDLASRLAGVCAPQAADTGHDSMRPAGPRWRVRWATGSQVAPRLLHTLDGHTAELSTIATATVGDRQVAITGGYADTTMRVWDLASGEELARIDRAAPTWAAATTVIDGRPVVVAGGYGSAIDVYDLATGQPVSSFDGGHGQPYTNAVCVAVLDGRPVVMSTCHTDDGDRDTYQEDPTVRVHDLSTGQPISSIRTDHSGAVCIAAALVDGRPVVVCGGTSEPPVRLWDLSTGQPVGEPLVGHSAGITEIVTTVVDGRPVAVSASYDGTVRRWDLITGAPIGQPLDGHAGRPVTDVAVVTVDGRPIAVTKGWDDTLQVWDVATGVPVVTPVPAREVGAVAATIVDGVPVAVTAMRDSTVRVWSLAPQAPVGQPMIGHGSVVCTVAVATVNARPTAVTASRDGVLRRWDLGTGEQVGQPHVLENEHLRCVAVADGIGREGPLVVVAASQADSWDWSGTLRWFDPSSWQLVGAAAVSTPMAYSLATTVLGGRRVVVAGGPDGKYHGEARGWDLTTGEPIGEPLTGHEWSVHAVATTRLGGRTVAVTASQDKTIRVWDLATGRPVGTPLHGHTETIGALAIGSAVGRTVAVSGDRSGTVRLWDLAAGTTPNRLLTGHDGPVTTLATGWIDRRPVAVSGGQDRTVRFWDLTTIEPIGHPLPFAEPVTALAVAPGGLVVCFGFEVAFIAGPIATEADGSI